MALIAYHGKKAEKVAILAQLRKHRLADELVHGIYWSGGKGCAVGCTIHSPDHMLYESRFGIPVMLARLEDLIFELLANGQAKEWPERFMGAVVVGANLRPVGWQFLYWLLTDEKANPGIHHPLVKDAVKQCADVVHLMVKGDSRAAGSAASAAGSAASAARIAAYSAGSAARIAAYSAASAAWMLMADKLIELISNCKGA